jgi:hypothetical protein
MVKFFLMLSLFYLTFLSSPRVAAQEDFSANKRIVGIQVDTLNRNIASILFDKSFKTYHWTGAAFYRNSLGPLFLNMNEQFLSTLIRTDGNLITNNQSFDLRLRYRLTDKLSAASNVSSFILSDNKSYGTSIGKASSHGAYAGIAYQPVGQFIVEPLIGVRFDNQLNQYDKGISYLLNLSSDTIAYSGYLGRLSGSFQYDKLDPRTIETRNVSIGIEKIFFEQTRNFLQFNYYRNHRDFYLPADSALKAQYNIVYNVESRVDDAFAISDTLDYNVDGKMFWTFQGNVFTREINRSTRYKNTANLSLSQPNSYINELKLEGLMQGMYIFSNSIRSSLTFSYLERDEKHHLQGAGGTAGIDLLERNEERKDNHARRSALVSTTEWRVSRSDTVAFSGSATILRYDTPSHDNDDDRDELWYLINFSTHHRINQHIRIHLSADASLTHLVYLFATRSADNNWNRIIRLAPRLEYMPWEELVTTNTFEVLANYTAFDFESRTSDPRSYAYRQFAFTDSSNLTLTTRLGVQWLSNIRLYERGELRWDTFSERPINYFDERTFLGTLSYRFSKSLLLSLGIRYFSQSKFDLSGSDRALSSYLRSIGPTSSIEINIGTGTHCSIRGWYESQTQTGQPNRGVTTMALLLNKSL